MRITSNECDDEEDDLPYTKITPESEKKHLISGLKRSGDNLTLSEIPDRKKSFFVKLPLVSSTKFDQKRLTLRKNKKQSSNSENLIKNQNKKLKESTSNNLYSIKTSQECKRSQLSLNKYLNVKNTGIKRKFNETETKSEAEKTVLNKELSLNESKKNAEHSNKEDILDEEVNYIPSYKFFKTKNFNKSTKENICSDNKLIESDQIPLKTFKQTDKLKLPSSNPFKKSTVKEVENSSTVVKSVDISTPSLLSAINNSVAEEKENLSSNPNINESVKSSTEIKDKTNLTAIDNKPKYYKLTYSSLGIKEPKRTRDILSLALPEISHKSRQNETTTVPNSNNIHNNISLNVQTQEDMSVYDRRVQADDRPVNGYSSRAIHNDDTSNSMNNHYYQCPQQSMATLCNIGNTCYLNSVVYTLRFAPMFLHNLHHLVDDLSSIHQNIGKYHVKSSSLGRNISGLHMESTRSWSSKDLASLENISCDMPKSNQQIATEKLHELYQNLHRNECTETTEPFHADTFLHAIQDVSAIFEGNQQQDAHEFLMCVLDSIRETCQSLIKAISECPDVITNGCISLPEQLEPHNAIAKEKPLQRDTGSSAITKTSFFSRKSKRKDESKNSKNNRVQSPHKDNTQITPSTDSGDTLNGSKQSLKINSIPEDELPLKDKERLSDKIKRLGLDFFTEDFEGITVSTTKCLSCETVTEQKETMIDIAVPMTGYENIDLGDKFIQDSCVTKEYFRGENKYRCEQCMGYTEAIRSISYEVLPRLLVIQLSRFSGVMEKINTYLPTPFTLQCFCAKCLGSSESKNLHVYKLYSVITHVGATMSVGHYIAYTCSLDWANDYINCPKDRMRQAQMNATKTTVGNSNTTSNLCNGPEKNVTLMKKIIFGRNKASSSGDMSKTMKNINGLSNSKTVSNGIEKTNINSTCPSVNCCGLQLRNNNYHSTTNSSNYNSGNTMMNNSSGFYLDMDDNNQQTSYNSSSNNFSSSTSGYGSANRNRIQNSSEPIWYMCDDDKIKAMSQREFEDILSPNRKIMITPYLLFYARSDVQ